MTCSTAIICAVLAALATVCCAQLGPHPSQSRSIEIVGEPVQFVPGIVSTEFAEVRLTLSPDGRTALWFSRDRSGGPGEYDIWMSKLTRNGWSEATPVPFNSPQRDFDPAFAPDGKYVYFCSNRPGGLGGDDIYRVEVSADEFAPAELLGPQVNSGGNEWAPMLSGDGTLLLFSSNGRGGAGRFDLFTSRRSANTFEAATPLPGAINTPADEFDATFLSDSATVVFARAPDLQADTVSLFQAALQGQRYEVGAMLPASINWPGKDAYGAMLDWSQPNQFTFSSQREEAKSVDVYVARYRLVP